jgi:hypothetical protein
MIEALSVIDHTHERLLHGRLRKQAEDRQAHEESVRGRSVLEAEHGSEGLLLRARETTESIQHRRAHLMERRERQLRLRLDGRDPDRPAPGRMR